MTKQYSRAEIVQGRLALGLLVGFAVVGLLSYGLPSAETFGRMRATFAERLDGPLSFRGILQPVMAAIAAMLDGYRDAKSQKPPYLQNLMSQPLEIGLHLHEALLSTARIILLGLAMDTIFQIMVFQSFFPFEAAAVTILLAFLPYVILRGPFRRLAGWWLARRDL